ncbi:MAG TPA: hypothetical protein VHY08_03465 [Bacillota bacterium]|nr:hypothetical protein [Bacillota bacterium]
MTTNTNTPGNTDFGKIDPQKITKILEAGGLEYQEGVFTHFDFLAYYRAGIIHNCNGNNAKNPYMTCGLLPAPGQTCSDLVPLNLDPRFPPDTYHASFHLGANEAILMVGYTPPKGNYFSYTPFVTSRWADFDVLDSVSTSKLLDVTPLRTIPKRAYNPKSHREKFFAPLGSPLNNLKINTPGSPLNNPEISSRGNSFGQLVVIVFTANQDLQQRIYDTFTEDGYGHSLNTLVVPNALTYLGLTEQADTFSIGFRIAGDYNDPLIKPYVDNPPMSVYRVTAPGVTEHYLPTPRLIPAGTGWTEMNYFKPVERLRQAILDTYPGYDAVELRTDTWLEEGYITIQQNTDDLGAARDTPYTATGTFKLPDNAFLIAYGVNHAQSGKCTYSNVNVYGSRADNGVLSVTNDDFGDSASVYLKEAVAADLYAWKFTYDVNDTEPYCTVIPREDPLKSGPLPPYAIGLDEPIYIGFRAYMEPETTVGPAWHELIIDRVIVFVPKTV